MTSKKITSLTHTRRKGAAAIEFAIAASMLITLMLGCTDFGRFVYVYVVVNNAASEGATYGSLNGITKFGSLGAWQTAVVNAAVGETTVHPIVAADVTVDGAAVANSLCKVTVTHQFTVLVPWPGMPQSATLTCTAAMPLIK